MHPVRKLGHQQDTLDGQQQNQKDRISADGGSINGLPVQIRFFLSPLTKEPVRLSRRLY